MARAPAHREDPRAVGTEAEHAERAVEFTAKSAKCAKHHVRVDRPREHGARARSLRIVTFVMRFRVLCAFAVESLPYGVTRPPPVLGGVWQLSMIPSSSVSRVGSSMISQLSDTVVGVAVARVTRPQIVGIADPVAVAVAPQPQIVDVLLIVEGRRIGQVRAASVRDHVVVVTHLALPRPSPPTVEQRTGGNRHRPAVDRRPPKTRT